MTVGEWIAARAPDVPPALDAQIRAALGSALQQDVAHAPEACVRAASSVVTDLLDARRTGREAALPLLAADALVTYAFEAAADDIARLTVHARTAMATLAAMR